METKDAELTGFFTDGLRRIDIVLVIPDGSYEENVDKIKIDFLINIVKIGLEVEMEAAVRFIGTFDQQGLRQNRLNYFAWCQLTNGEFQKTHSVESECLYITTLSQFYNCWGLLSRYLPTAEMKRHEKLIFVKVHAPTQLIEKYGRYFNIQKYFKETHNEFINPNHNLLFMKDEKDFIKTVRKYYPVPLNYTNVERSTIVYHILLLLPFGQHGNFMGLQRLLERNIIEDAYALHDGPYLYIGNQISTKINARQVLFYNWVGKKYLFSRQPVHLIREYLGEKVGFYFAYYEYLNISLIFATLLGIFMSIEGLYDITDDEIIKEACYKNRTGDESVLTVCPLCRDFNTCPFRNLTDFCAKVTITNFIDNPWTMIYCILISLWAILFILLWRRRKNCLSWSWEYDQTDTRNAVRSEFDTNVSKINLSKLTGVITDTDTIQLRIYRLVLIMFSLLLWILLVLTITVIFFIWKYELSAKFNDLSNIWRDYLAVITITCINVIMMSMLQKISRTLCYHLSCYENHKTYNSFETAYITKLFGFSFVCNFTLLILYYFMNLLYTYPADKNRWYLVAGVGMLNCGPESCLDELCVALIVTILVKEYLFNLPALFFKTKSDYTVTEDNVPCWEREYLLKPFTEYILIEKFNDLVLKFTLVGLFGTVFPLTPLLLLISGICNLRQEASQLVVASRRPLLRQPCSQRVWYKIMLAVVYAVPCFNTVAMTWMTTMLHYSRIDHETSYFNFSMGRFITEDYKKVIGSGSPAEAIESYKGFVPTECLFPGLRFRSTKLDGEYYPIERFWRIRYDKHRLMLEVEHLALLLMVILHCAIPAYPRDVTDTMSAEERIKRRGKNSELISK